MTVDIMGTSAGSNGAPQTNTVNQSNLPSASEQTSTVSLPNVASDTNPTTAVSSQDAAHGTNTAGVNMAPPEAHMAPRTQSSHASSHRPLLPRFTKHKTGMSPAPTQNGKSANTTGKNVSSRGLTAPWATSTQVSQAAQPSSLLPASGPSSPLPRLRFSSQRRRRAVEMFRTVVRTVTEAPVQSSDSSEAERRLTSSSGAGWTGTSGSGSGSGSRSKMGVDGDTNGLARTHTRRWRSGSGKVSQTATPSGDDLEKDRPCLPVHVVVVDNDFSNLARVDPRPTPAHDSTDNLRLGPTDDPEALPPDARPPWGSSSHITHSEGSWPYSSASRRTCFSAFSEFICDRAWPALRYFFSPRFPEPSKERAYQMEIWAGRKLAAFGGSMMILMVWVLYVAMRKPHDSFERHYYYITLGILIVPLPILVVFNGPLRFNWFYQPWLAVVVWCWGIIMTFDMTRCNYFSDDVLCTTPKFMTMFGYLEGTPALAILVMGQSRIWDLCGVVVWCGIAGGTVMQNAGLRPTIARNMTGLILFHFFLLLISYWRESADRNLFQMRQQLKMQFKAVQKAQVMERRAEQSKKKFVSYIFHEIRVPLNTALLSMQLLEGEGVFKRLDQDGSDMIHGMKASLHMMEKVLDDVLSFNRMEAGKLVQARKPFNFHKAVQVVSMSYQIQAEVNGLTFAVNLDPRINDIQRCFIGDEMRLRQVLSNLVSNALKFTRSGGVVITTKLVHLSDPSVVVPKNDPPSIVSKTDGATGVLNAHEAFTADPEKGDAAKEEDHNGEVNGTSDLFPSITHETATDQWVVVRVEIHDTGVGIKPEDMGEDCLFTPFAQSEIGRRQGGKGSGLGLALVRQIVTISGGRLGVDSQVGSGSTFWFELPYQLSAESGSTTGSCLFDKRPSRPSSPTSAAPVGLPHAPGLVTSKTPTVNWTDRRPASASEEARYLSRTTSAASGVSVVYAKCRKSIQSAQEEANEAADGGGQTQIDPSSTNGLSPVELETHQPLHTEPGWKTKGSADGHASEATVRLSEVNGESLDALVTPSLSTPGTCSTAFNSPPIISPLSDSTVTPSIERTMSLLPESSSALERPLRALVVDDDVLTRKLMARMIRRLGHHVTTAENGKICYDMICAAHKAQLAGSAAVSGGSSAGTSDPSAPSLDSPPQPKQFDVIWLDNQMPVMTGVECAREIRKLGADVFIVGCTGNALGDDTREYLEAGADHVLSKPIHQARVVEMIAEVRLRLLEQEGEGHMALTGSQLAQLRV